VADVTEPQQPGNKNMPDFKELNDRVIAEQSEGPFLVIKTNVDPKDATAQKPLLPKQQTDR
jgi:hypothetical protein